MKIGNFGFEVFRPGYVKNEDELCAHQAVARAIVFKELSHVVEKLDQAGFTIRVASSFDNEIEAHHLQIDTTAREA